MKKLILLLSITTFVLGYAQAQTSIHNSYFSANLTNYNWDIGGSPYQIMEDIEIPDGSNLIIEPGVEVLFQAHYKIDVKGSINAIGTANERISFTSDAGNPWNGIRFDFSDNPYPASSKLHFCDISNSVKNQSNCGCSDPDCSGGAIFIKKFSNLEIFECEIFNNYAQGQGGAIDIFYFSSPTITNCKIHDNTAMMRGGAISIFEGCNPQIKGNHIYENISYKGGGAFLIGHNATGTSTPSNPFLDGNKIYQNSAQLSANGTYGDGGGVFICGSNPVLNNNDFNNNTAASNGVHDKFNFMQHLSLIH